MATRQAPRRSFFDAWSRFYDQPAVQLAVYRPVHEVVLAELRRRPARRVLDAGCGTGNLTVRLAAEAGAGLVVGCDFSLGMLEQASRKAARGAWVQADALRLPLDARSVDAVISTESFHWFPDHDAALAEFRRVLGPGGRLVVALVNPRLRVTSAAVRAGSALAGQPAYWPTRRELAQRLEASGFRVVRQHRVPRAAGLVLPTFVTVAERAATY